MTDYLSLKAVPTAIGFDPRLQLLHEEDAVEALRLSILGDATGIYNIAGDGVVFLSQAIRLMGRVPLPLLLPAAQITAGLLRQFGLIDFPTDQLKLILFGRVIDTKRARDSLGFEPRFSTLDAIKDLKAHRSSEIAPEPSAHPTWERELFEYLKQRATSDREKV
jgi:UDP-glucose 4-epimerase